jgi:hypothetical protein
MSPFGSRAWINNRNTERGIGEIEMNADPKRKRGSDDVDRAKRRRHQEEVCSTMPSRIPSRHPIRFRLLRTSQEQAAKLLRVETALRPLSATLLRRTPLGFFLRLLAEKIQRQLAQMTAAHVAAEEYLSKLTVDEASVER